MSRLAYITGLREERLQTPIAWPQAGNGAPVAQASGVTLGFVWFIDICVWYHLVEA